MQDIHFVPVDEITPEEESENNSELSNQEILEIEVEPPLIIINESYSWDTESNTWWGIDCQDCVDSSVEESDSSENLSWQDDLINEEELVVQEDYFKETITEDSSSELPTQNDPPIQRWPTDPVIFPDTNLQNALCVELSRTNGCAITQWDMASFTWLYLYSKSITDLTWLEYAVNLTLLDLCDNLITNISALSWLTNLTHLYLNYNQITDITDLSWLVNITDIYLYNNKISNIDVLSSLPNLTTLLMQNNWIWDISVIWSFNLLQLMTNAQSVELLDITVWSATYTQNYNIIDENNNTIPYSESNIHNLVIWENIITNTWSHTASVWVAMWVCNWTVTQKVTLEYDTTPLTCSVTYNPNTFTYEDVIATLTWCSETITITNNWWLSGYIFTWNWSFTFTYEDVV